MMIPSDDPQQLSLLFHLNSEPWLNEDAYRAGSYHHEFKQIANVLERVALPPPPESRLASLIRQRKSARRYDQRDLPLASLSALLSCGYGVAEIASLDGAGWFLRRSVPSGGGLYPLEIYLFLKQVPGLRDGLYHY